jgi:hypothetical protein
MAQSRIDDQIGGIDARLAEIAACYSAWNEQLESERRRLVERGVDWWEAIERVHAIRLETIQAGASPVDFDRLSSLLDELCSIYLKAGEDQRIRIRAVFDDKESVLKYLHSYIANKTRRLRLSGEKKWLRLGLAAASICDQRVDWRDLMICLGHLYMVARDAGFRPGYQFRAVARISNPRGRHRQSSTRDLLANFRKSAYLSSIQRRDRPS